ncbi:cobalt-precorrin 5A hydrolase [Anaerotaenia torta]|uniref:cobalt-precorrin 5A hydrolase n=1 Tax=Anaerotaenia torta TaxID=433293 RepID=UPI003D22013D
MRISVISFTARGAELSRQIYQSLEHGVEQKTEQKTEQTIEQSTEQKIELSLYTKHKASGNRGLISVSEPLSAWTEKQFEEKNALLFIGACGIAVRAIAPILRDKLTDPPVLVMDEAGQFVIPVLSGHYGGANALAKQLADRIGATAVITTATDVNGLFAVDVFAKSNNLAICNRSGIGKVSSIVLEIETVTMAVAGKWAGTPPKEVIMRPYPVQEKVSVLVSPFEEGEDSADLQLCPRAILVGIGCRRGRTLSQIEAVLHKRMKKAGIRWEAVAAIASVDRKKEEEGLMELAAKYRIPFQTFSPGELSRVEGEFQASAFVQEQVGTDNVCERSAMAAAGSGGRLISEKYAEDGITIAIALQDWRVVFDEI